MEAIEVRDMNISINLDGSITSIIGPSKSGKTYFALKMCNRIKNDDIYIDDICIKDYDISYLRENICAAINEPSCNTEYVAEELFFNINKLGYRVNKITKEIETIAKYFKIHRLLDKKMDDIYLEDRVLITILSYLIIKPKIFVIDTLLDYLSEKYVKLIIKYAKENNINLIIITSNPEYLLLCDNVIVLNNYKAILSSNVKTVLVGNTILPYMGIKLPFIVDLSQNLILYKVIDKVYFEDRKLVDKLWK